MAGFRSATENFLIEKKTRVEWPSKALSFGIKFLDEAVRGILPNDLFILGAPSGIGKTQLCANIAINNAMAGKRVHYFALEAREFEIEQRLKYQKFAQFFFDDPEREKLPTKLNYKDWLLSKFDDQLKKYEDAVKDFSKNVIKNFFTTYKINEEFTHKDLLTHVYNIQNETDLIIIDHLHYFDWHDDNDSRAIKEIIKVVRSLSLEMSKPIILVSHLRKKDKNNSELAADLDEFHGSSEIFKIATGAFTIGTGGAYEDKFLTYLRIPKLRDDGSVSRYIAKVLYDPKTGEYEDEYNLSYSFKKNFEQLGAHEIPFWARSCRVRDLAGEAHQAANGFFEGRQTQKNLPRRYNPSERD